MTRVLVTGGAGYLGSVLVPMLGEKGYDVRVFDTCWFPRNANPVSDDSYQFVAGDLRDLYEFPGLLNDVGAIIHLAAISNDPSAELDPHATRQINVYGTIGLAREAAKRGVERFIFASSCSVYGAQGDALCDEQTETHPLSLYAATKLEAEKALRNMASRDFCPVILRQATLFGPSPRMRFDLAVNLMAACAVKRQRVEVFNQGEHWRPFIHVADAAWVIMQMLEADADTVRGETFNVGTDYLNYQIKNLGAGIAHLFPGCSVSTLEAEEPDRRSYKTSFRKLHDFLERPCIGVDGCGWWSVSKGAQEIAEMLGDGTVTDPFDDRYYNVRHMRNIGALE